MQKFSILLSSTLVHSTFSLQKPLIIGHRGASGIYPQHTRISYTEAAKSGVDFIECDLGLTKDLKLVCVHDNYLNGTTDISKVYPERFETKFWAGKERTDWFTTDFTLSELESVNVVQYEYRDQSLNGEHKITSFVDFTEIAVEYGVGIYVETKNSTDFNAWLSAENEGENSEALTFEQILFEEMKVNFFDSGLPIFYQSFQLESIVRLKTKNEYENSQFTFLSLAWPSHDDLQIMEENGINGLGIWKNRIVEVDSETRRLTRNNGEVSVRRDKLEEVKSHGVVNIHVFTFKNECEFIPFDFEQDYVQEFEFWWTEVREVNGFFCDFPKSAVRAWEWYEKMVKLPCQ